MEHPRTMKRYNMTLDPKTKDATMKLLRGDESLSGIVQGFLEKFVEKRTKSKKKKKKGKK